MGRENHVPGATEKGRKKAGRGGGETLPSDRAFHRVLHPGIHSTLHRARKSAPKVGSAGEEEHAEARPDQRTRKEQREDRERKSHRRPPPPCTAVATARARLGNRSLDGSASHIIALERVWGARGGATLLSSSSPSRVSSSPPYSTAPVLLTATALACGPRQASAASMGPLLCVLLAASALVASCAEHGAPRRPRIHIYDLPRHLVEPRWVRGCRSSAFSQARLTPVALYAALRGGAADGPPAPLRVLRARPHEGRPVLVRHSLSSSAAHTAPNTANRIPHQARPVPANPLGNRCERFGSAFWHQASGGFRACPQ